MHGFLWSLHKDHHKKDHSSWFERNDLFFIFYAVVSMVLVILWGEYGFWAGLPMAFGIFTYGMTYFIVHDILSTAVLKFSDLQILNMLKV